MTKKKIKFNKKIVTLIIILNTMFAWSVLYVFLRTGNEPGSLIIAWFGFTGGELWLLSGLKKKEISQQSLKKEEDLSGE